MINFKIVINKILFIDRFRYIRKMIPKLRRCLGVQDLAIFILDVLAKRHWIRKITISETEIYIRTNTPDLQVAISSLCEGEYKNIRLIDPKYIIDAGANIGTSAIFFSRRYPAAKIIAIEPEQSNFELLVKNTSSIKNITRINAALWGVPARKEIKNRFTGQWGYTVSNTEEQSELTGQEIDCITMDMLMEDYGIKNIDFVKMDIEGGEKNVFEHSSTWIDNVKVLTVELHDRICIGCSRAFYLATENFSLLEKHGEKVTIYKDNLLQNTRKK